MLTYAYNTACGAARQAATNFSYNLNRMRTSPLGRFAEAALWTAGTVYLVRTAADYMMTTGIDAPYHLPYNGTDNGVCSLHILDCVQDRATGGFHAIATGDDQTMLEDGLAGLCERFQECLSDTYEAWYEGSSQDQSKFIFEDRNNLCQAPIGICSSDTDELLGTLEASQGLNTLQDIAADMLDKVYVCSGTMIRNGLERYRSVAVSYSNAAVHGSSSGSGEL